MRSRADHFALSNFPLSVVSLSIGVGGFDSRLFQVEGGVYISIFPAHLLHVVELKLTRHHYLIMIIIILICVLYVNGCSFFLNILGFLAHKL